jgi:hypothetical protein
VLVNRQPFCNADPRLDLPPQLAEHFAGYRTLAAFPLVKDDETYGALTLYSSALAEYGANDRRLLEEAVTLLTPMLSTNAEHTPAAPRPIVAETYEPAGPGLTSELAH